MSNGKRGGQPDNNNATKGRLWARAIDKALEQKSKTDAFAEMIEIAKELLKKCKEGDLGAIKEFGDRIDGKPAQSVTLLGDEDKPLVTKVIREIVDPKD